MYNVFEPSIGGRLVFAMPDDVARWLQARATGRNSLLNSRLAAIQGTRDTPTREEIVTGSARETRGAILFADVVDSTRLAMRYAGEPDKMLATLNLVIPALMDAAWLFGGEFEKNTGDGVLAYFGMGDDPSDGSAAASCVNAAHAMLWATARVVNPLLRSRGLQEVKITVGADLGDVLLARIGLQRVRNGTPMVAVGVVANRAAKIQERAKPGQVRIGEDLWKALAPAWRQEFRPITPGEGWPFRVRRPPTEVARERILAEQAAEASSTQLVPPLSIAGRVTARGSYFEDLFTRSPSRVGLPIPVYVSETRPYRTYLARWSF
jgi:class 3 adenylate cyclase